MKSPHQLGYVRSLANIMDVLVVQLVKQGTEIVGSMLY